MCRSRTHVRGTAASRPAGTPARRSRRSGFSVLELLIVMTILGTLGAMSGSRLVKLRASMAVRSARQEMTSLLRGARGTAVRQARPVRARVGVDSAWTAVDTGRVTTGSFAKTGRTIRWTDLRITVASSPTLDSVYFDMRGIGRVYVGGGSTATTSSVVLRFSRDRAKDSVCVTPVGTAVTCGT